MADSAKLTIEIADADIKPGAVDSGDADILARWKKLTEAMGRAADDLATRYSRLGFAPTGGGSGGEGPFDGKRFSQLDADSQRRVAMNGRPEGVTDREWSDYGRDNARRGVAGAKIAGKAQEQIAKQREEEEAGPFDGKSFGQLDSDSQRRVSLHGRPEGVSDEEWSAYGKENARRGVAGAKIAGKAQDQIAKQREEEEAARQEEQDEREAEQLKMGRESARRGKEMARISMKAAAQRKRLQEEAELEAKRQEEERKSAAERERQEDLANRIYLTELRHEQESQFQRNEKRKKAEEEAEGNTRKARLGAAAGAAAGAMLRGGGPGASAGSALGTLAGEALGARYGPAGKAFGSMAGAAIGEKVGGAVDHPLQGAANASSKVAGGDALGLIRGGTSAVGGGIGAAGVGLTMAGMPMLGLPLAVGGMALKAAGDAMASVKEAADAFASRGKELSGYNGKIAGAAAMQDVTRTLTDIRESQRLGGGYANLIAAQTRFEETLKAGLLPVKEWLLGILPGWLDRLLEMLIQLVKIGYAIPGVKDEFVDKVLKEMKGMKEALAGGGMADVDDLFKAWLTPPVIAGVEGAFPPAPVPLGIPLIPPA